MFSVESAILAEARGVIFRLRCFASEMKVELAIERKRTAKLKDELLEAQREIERLRHPVHVVWVNRSLTTPALDAQIAELSAYQKDTA